MSKLKDWALSLAIVLGLGIAAGPNCGCIGFVPAGVAPRAPSMPSICKCEAVAGGRAMFCECPGMNCMLNGDGGISCQDTRPAQPAAEKE